MAAILSDEDASLERSESESKATVWVAWFHKQKLTKTPEAYHMMCKSIRNVLRSAELEGDITAERSMSRVIFMLTLFLAIGAANEYMWAVTWPKGRPYFCRLPYFGGFF